jgi:hypothetical protein
VYRGCSSLGGCREETPFLPTGQARWKTESRWVPCDQLGAQEIQRRAESLISQGLGAHVRGGRDCSSVPSLQDHAGSAALTPDQEPTLPLPVGPLAACTNLQHNSARDALYRRPRVNGDHFHE